MATVSIPLALWPQVSGTPKAYPSLIALTATDLMVLRYLQDVDGICYGIAKLPPTLAAVPNARIEATFMWNATAGVARLSLASKAIADGESFNPGALTSEAAQDIAVPGTAYLAKVVTFPAVGALAEVVAGADHLLVQLKHEGAHANDTVAVDTLLVCANLLVDV